MVVSRRRSASVADGRFGARLVDGSIMVARISHNLILARGGHNGEFDLDHRGRVVRAVARFLRPQDWGGAHLAASRAGGRRPRLLTSGLGSEEDAPAIQSQS